jgi:GT2 family glycosyltransferase
VLRIDLIDTPFTPGGGPSADAEVAPRTSVAQSVELALLPRPVVRGKFLAVGEETLLLRGVTYGPFASSAGDADSTPSEYHTEQVVEKDFRAMAARGINAVRTYTVPPRWLLDIAARHGLRVLVGLAWEQHVTFLERREGVVDIERRVREGVRSCAGHPAVLGYAVGNEIAAPLVRWYGAARIERFIERLYLAAKQEDPDGLVTYVNYPSTEYLNLPFLDFSAFNVYLESPDTLQAYLSRLQNLAGDRPLVMAELGFDSRRHGEEKQASVLQWQVRTTFERGCAGAFIFSWTDEWSRGGVAVSDWGFGLTDENHQPKPALEAVAEAFERIPFGDRDWPSISLVICTYNGSKTLRKCLDGIARLTYPGKYEVLLVDDGSTDETPAIAKENPDIRVIRTTNHGLSSARNTGMHAAMGEIIAYTDDDAWPDPHYLTYLADHFLKTDCAGVGGPNLAPDCGGTTADCVAHAPGGPTHVLLTDTIAEHIPGCNMAFRRDRLLAVGGFDPQFRIAGDDVDVCWQLQERGWTLGFCAAAVVWHIRRPSLRAFWRQQANYGKAEADLERKWPEKYNAVGHLPWTGRMYSGAFAHARLLLRQRVYHGTWGSAPFQQGESSSPALLAMLPLVPEWYLFLAVMAYAICYAPIWPKLWWLLPIFGVCAGLTVGCAATNVPRIWLMRLGHHNRITNGRRMKLWLITLMLHILQPVARLWGRFARGLTPWRKHVAPKRRLSLFSVHTRWSESWISSEQRLLEVETSLKGCRAAFRRGGGYDAWDVEVRGGLIGKTRITLVAEEHGQGRQLVRIRLRPVCGFLAPVVVMMLTAGAGIAVGLRHSTTGIVAGSAALILLLKIVMECSSAASLVHHALEGQDRDEIDETDASGTAQMPLQRLFSSANAATDEGCDGPVLVSD